MSDTAKRRKALKDLAGIVEEKLRSKFDDPERLFSPQRILLEQENLRLRGEDEKRVSKRTIRQVDRKNIYDLYRKQVKLLKQLSEIRYARQPKEGILIHGRVVDSKFSGLNKYGRKNIYVTLNDKNLKPIEGISAKRCQPDISGYYSITLTQKDVETLKERKIDEPVLKIEDRNKGLIRGFETIPLHRFSKAPLGSRLTTNISLTSTEKARRKKKRADETKLTEIERQKLEIEASLEKELEERMKREEADRLAFEEDMRARLEAEAAEKLEIERKKIEEAERELETRFEERLRERLEAELASMETEVAERLDAERIAAKPKLEDISGIGTERAKKLREIGLTNVEEFYRAPDKTIGETLRLREESIRKMKEESVSLLLRAPR